MSKNKYLKPEIEIVGFNNKDNNMSPTYLLSGNYDKNSIDYNAGTNSIIRGSGVLHY